MRVKMEQYFQDNRVYTGACAAGHGRAAAARHAVLPVRLQSAAGGRHLHHRRDRHRRDGRLRLLARPDQHAARPWPAGRLGHAGTQHLLGDQEGRIVLTPRRPAGFTMVELLIGMAILAIVVGLGVPAMGTYLQNAKLAIRRPPASTPASRRPAPRRFAATSSPSSSSPICRWRSVSKTTAGLPAANGRSWVVRSLLPAPAAAWNVRPVDIEVVERRRGQRGRAEHRRQLRRFPPVARHDSVQRLRRHGRQPGLPDQYLEPGAPARARPGGPVRCRQHQGVARRPDLRL